MLLYALVPFLSSKAVSRFHLSPGVLFFLCGSLFSLRPRLHASVMPGVLEKLRVRTIGVKDTLTEELAGMPLPLELFTNEGLQTKG